MPRIFPEAVVPQLRVQSQYLPNIKRATGWRGLAPQSDTVCCDGERRLGALRDHSNAEKFAHGEDIFPSAISHNAVSIVVPAESVAPDGSRIAS